MSKAGLFAPVPKTGKMSKPVYGLPVAGGPQVK